MTEDLNIINSELEIVEYRLLHTSIEFEKEELISWHERLLKAKKNLIIKILEKYETNTTRNS